MLNPPEERPRVREVGFKKRDEGFSGRIVRVDLRGWDGRNCCHW